jgi:hypothetical protein
MLLKWYCLQAQLKERTAESRREALRTRDIRGYLSPVAGAGGSQGKQVKDEGEAAMEEEAPGPKLKGRKTGAGRPPAAAGRGGGRGRKGQQGTGVALGGAVKIEGGAVMAAEQPHLQGGMGGSKRGSSRNKAQSSGGIQAGTGVPSNSLGSRQAANVNEQQLRLLT